MLEKLQDAFSSIIKNVSGKGRITEKNIEEAAQEIKLALLEADVNLRVARRFINGAVEEAKGEKVLKAINPGQQFVKIVYDRLTALLGGQRQRLELRGPDVTSVILLAGLQGAGKTTTAAKLALSLKKEGRRPLLAACDLIRPAAAEQLKTLGAQIEVPVFTGEAADKSPASRAAAALKHAQKHQFDTLIVDTAGRMQADEALMAELKEIESAVKPVEKLLAADAMTGQSAADIAKAFNETVGLTGVILSKFDSDARGGAALSLKSVSGVAIKYAGSGEKIEDLEPFYPERAASRILGMGDIVSLVEKAQEAVDTEQAEKMQAKLFAGSFTLGDYLEQMQAVKKMGKAGQLAKLLPGLSAEQAENGFNDKKMAQEEAIILSMTPKERLNPLILNSSRRKRIASGSGVTAVDVNRFLNRFEKMKTQIKKINKNKKYQAQLMKSLGQM